MLITIIIFVVILSVLVFVHEIGHFWTARRFGIKVEEFGFGLPPRIFGLQIWREQKIAKAAEIESVNIEIAAGREADGSMVSQEIITDRIREIDRLTLKKKMVMDIGARQRQGRKFRHYLFS